MNTLRHRQIQLLLQADESLSAEQQARLAEHLAVCAECRAYAEGLKNLRAALPGLCPADALAADELKQMRAGITESLRSKPMHTRLNNTFRTLAWGGLVLLLVALVAWSIRTLAPMPALDLTLTPTLPAPTAIPTRIDETLPPLPVETTPIAPTGEPLATPSGQAALFPEVQFTFATALPAEPQQAILYQQYVPDLVNAEAAAQMAAQLGVQGTPTQSAGEASWQTIFEVADGVSSVRFINFPGQFVFGPLATAMPAANAVPLTFEQRAAIAEAFLVSHQLLNVPYRVEPAERDANTVRFVQLLDGYPVIYGIGASGGMGWIDVTVDDAGQVSWLMHSAHDFRPAGSYPVLSAQQAWERFSGPQGAARSIYFVLPAEQVERSWEREYPLGQRLEILGTVNTSGTALTFSALGISSDWLLSGAVGGLAGQNDPFVLLIGQFEEVNGTRTLNVETWEARSVDDIVYASGVIYRQGDQGLLTTEDGQEYTIPALPADLPDGVWANFMGILNAQNILEWSSMDTVVTMYGSSSTCYGGGGGGGGSGPSNANIGGGSFAQLNLNDQNLPTPTPIPVGSQAGQVLDGASGYAFVTIYQNAGGSRTTVELFTDNASYLLEGSQALVGIEQYHNLPVRVWGTISRYEEALPVVMVERFEPLYPGVQVQAWQGTYQVVTLEGIPVPLFTSQDGAQYVPVYAPGQPVSPDFVAVAGEAIIVEGFVIPDQTYGGYATLKIYGAGMGGDLESYEITANQPYLMDETQDEGNGAVVLSGKVTIESVELAYTAVSLDGCQPEHNNDPLTAGLYTQPMWVFRGHFEDGRRFEIRVQALPDEYLK